MELLFLKKELCCRCCTVNFRKFSWNFSEHAFCRTPVIDGSLYFPCPGPFLGPGTGPPYWPPICIYRPWPSICVYQSWLQICINGIYRYWSLKLYLPTLDPAMAPNLYFPVQVKILPLLPQPLVLSLPLLLPPPLLLQLPLLLPLSLLLITITTQ